jgi:hypothetical protein
LSVPNIHFSAALSFVLVVSLYLAPAAGGAAAPAAAAAAAAPKEEEVDALDGGMDMFG